MSTDSTTIQQLEKENRKLRRALKQAINALRPFAKAVDKFQPGATYPRPFIPRSRYENAMHVVTKYSDESEGGAK